MDPLSALSVAGTVVQFLDFSIKLVSKSSEIAKSAAGTTVRNAELESIALNLTSVVKRVRKRSERVCAFATSQDELALQDLCEGCSCIGQELVDTLNRAKVRGSSTRWKSIRQALKEMLGGDRVKEIYQRLSAYREQIVVLLLVIAGVKQDNLDASIRNVDETVREFEAKIMTESRRTRAEILTAIKTTRYNTNDSQDLAHVYSMLASMSAVAQIERTNEDVLNSLYYPRMSDRKEWITQAHEKTFSWALEGKSANRSDAHWDDLKWWLTDGEGIYWLAGKAGSGKSTLMKYIQQDNRTEQYLTVWAHPLPCVRASFYLWNPGTSMQKSQLGLLQCLLYEIFTQRPDLITKTLSPQRHTNGRRGESGSIWTLSELQEALKQLSKVDLRIKFCFFIDGLDEFDGDHQTLIQLLQQFTSSSNLKILASSRPWLVFDDAFRSSPKLMLQDLTYNDIRSFAYDSLHGHARFSGLLRAEPDRAPQLVSEIVTKSSGVFLWVHLVVRSLIAGLANADRMSDLQRRLEELPSDLEQFFMHIMATLDKFYLHQASQLFRLALEAPKPLSILTFSFLDEEQIDFAEQRPIQAMSSAEEAARCETIERRLKSRCKGLLESRKRQSCDAYSTPDGVVGEVVSYEVDFLHRTVRDFLSTPTVQVRLVAPDSMNWNANMVLARAHVAQLKGIQIASHVESNFQNMWSAVFDTLHHMARIPDDTVSPHSKLRLITELDRTAANLRALGVKKRRCSANVHWVNTGYRYGFEPKWNCDLLTLMIQHDLRSLVQLYLNMRGAIKHGGKPLLAFAMTRVGERSQEESKEGNQSYGGYDEPRKEIIKLLFKHGADPNDLDGDTTVWTRLLQSLYKLSCTSSVSAAFNSKARIWFDIVKLFLQNGARSATNEVPIISSYGLNESLRASLHQRLNSDKEFDTAQTYSVLQMIRMLFGADSKFDLSELEDLVDEVPESRTGILSNHLVSHRGPDSSLSGQTYLEVPGQSNNARGYRRSESVSSVRSQDSAVSWRRPTEDDIVLPRKPLPASAAISPQPSTDCPPFYHEITPVPSKKKFTFSRLFRRKPKQ